VLRLRHGGVAVVEPVVARLVLRAVAVVGRAGAKGGIAAVRQATAQGACTLRKDATAPSVAGSARALPGPRCFAPGAGSPRDTRSSRCWQGRSKGRDCRCETGAGSLRITHSGGWWMGPELAV